MALFTTTPASEMMPIMVMMITNSIWKMTSPSNTPMSEKTTLKPMMNGVVTLLNWLTMMRKDQEQSNEQGFGEERHLLGLFFLLTL